MEILWKCHDMDEQWTEWMLEFDTSSLVLYLARVQSVPHLMIFFIIDCDDGVTEELLVGFEVS